MKNTKTLVLIAFVLGAFTLSAQRIHRDTICEFSNPPSDKVIFKSPKGKFYKVNFMAETGKYFDAEELLAINCTDSTFAGSARKAAKTCRYAHQSNEQQQKGGRRKPKRALAQRYLFIRI
jgi:hypothetical protein